MTQLPPLRFRPVIRHYMWGGKRLGAELGKPIGDSETAAECWEIVDHGADQSVVAEGPLAGKTLHDIVTQHSADLFGRHHPRRQFPLLLKLLDCQKTLSVQVHPNDAQGAKLTPPDLGKTEAWFVLAADPGCKIYAGLKPGVDRHALESAVAAGTCEECLHEFEARACDCLLIEAGTVHALGAGLLIAEIQQASDTTYRLFDWNRVDRDGKPRELHIRQALDVIDFSRGPVEPVSSEAMPLGGVACLAKCDKFVLDRRDITKPQPLPRDERFHILAVVDGVLELRSKESSSVLQRGETILVPATTRDVDLFAQDPATVLDMYLPD